MVSSRLKSKSALSSNGFVSTSGASFGVIFLMDFGILSSGILIVCEKSKAGSFAGASSSSCRTSCFSETVSSGSSVFFVFSNSSSSSGTLSYSSSEDGVFSISFCSSSEFSSFSSSSNSSKDVRFARKISRIPLEIFS